MNRKVVVNLEAVIEFQRKNNLNNVRLAKAMGVSPTLVSRVKSKKRQPARSFIIGLIRAGMDPMEIFLKA